MLIRKTTLVLIFTAVFLLGFFAAQTRHFYQDSLLSAELRKKVQAARPPERKPEEPQPKPEDFFLSINLGELNQFDQLYDQRQTQLRDIMGASSPEEAPLIPEGVFAQLGVIESKIRFLADLKTFAPAQSVVKQNLLSAYHALRETYELEIEFLKKYPVEGGNINFITENIFSISAKDQQSGLAFLDCLINYRKLVAETVREDQSAEKNQSRVRDLVAVNALIEKYQTRFNIPKETVTIPLSFYQQIR